MTLLRSTKEVDYFTQLIYEALKNLEEEREKLNEFNYIRCPKCGRHLNKIYNGINADKYFQCDGIWLDRGDLEVKSCFEKWANNIIP